MVEVTFEPIKKAVVHGFQEYTFDDLMQEYISKAEVGGETIQTLVWADGVVMSVSWHPVDSPQFHKEYMDGIQHIHHITFALKEKFEKQVIKKNITVNFLDQSEMEVFMDLAKKLKEQSKYKTSSQ